MGQSMAALFTPENQRLRTAQKEGASSAGKAAGGFKVPGLKGTEAAAKPQDSLGDGHTPGYESWGKKKTGDESAAEGNGVATTTSPPAIELPQEGPSLIRLGLGWDKLLLAQKKVCEKAKNLFTSLEAPATYAGQRKKGKLQKMRGCIIDMELKDTPPASADAGDEKKDKAA
jgi:hypothetical protein